MPATHDSELKQQLRARATEAGFAAAGVAPAQLPGDDTQHLDEWIRAGHHATMDYIARHGAARASAHTVLPGARSVIVFAAPYQPHTRPTNDPPPPATYRIAKFALGNDYHTVLHTHIAPIVAWLSGMRPDHRWRVCIDSAPILERAFAVRAGIGFIGKNTSLIVPRTGSHVFLALVATTASIAPDSPAHGTCGHCTRCIDACPGRAIVAPRILDARRCISYLTIEKKGELADAERASLGARAFGCDTCQDVCPYNKTPRLTPFMEFREGRILHEFEPPSLFQEIPSNKAFARRFAGSPLLRAGLARMKRNTR